MTVYAPSQTTISIGVRQGNETDGERPSLLIPALIVGGGVAGAILISVSKKDEKKR